MWRGVLSLALAGCFVGCSFTPSGGTADDVSDDDDDGGTVSASFRDDTAADFAVADSIADSVVIEPWGAFAPAAYQAGGLVAHAANTQRFTQPTGTTWDTVVGASAAGTGLWTRPFTGDPIGVGLDSGDSWTYWAEGEVYLDAGDTTFLVDIDDAGFLEIAAPGGDFTRVVSATQGIGSGTYIAAAAGWYPIRLASVEGIGASRFDVQLYVGTSMTPQPLAGARLRSRVDGMRGMVLAGWDGSLLQGVPEHTISDATLVDARFQTGAPVGVGISSSDYWSLRWSGQFYVTMPGTYSLRVESDDGHRLYVGGQLVSDAFVGATQDRTVSVQMDAGWNDIVLDLSENTGDASVRLRVTGGPEPGLDAELPLSRLRPLEPRDERVETIGDEDDVPIPDNDPGGSARGLHIAASPGATVSSVDVIIAFNHPRVSDLQLRLIHPGGNEVLLRNNSSEGGSGPRALRFTTDMFDDTPAAGTWGVRVTDTAQAQAGTVTDLQLAVHMHDGPDQIARTASYTSAVHDLGAGVKAIGAVHVGARVPAGASVAVRVRGCDAPEACAAEAWSAPLADGDSAGLPARRYLQYRVELTSNGEREPEVDWVEVAYSLPP